MDDWKFGYDRVPPGGWGDTRRGRAAEQERYQREAERRYWQQLERREEERGEEEPQPRAEEERREAERREEEPQPRAEEERREEERREAERLIAEAQRIVDERRRAQKLAWARRVLAAENSGEPPAANAADVRAELRQDGELRWRVWARDKYTCRVCGARGESAELTIDHIIPVDAGGSNDVSNLQTLCRSCNSRKGARIT